MVNRSPSIALDYKTPQEVWYGKPSNYSGLRIFGCPAYAHVDDGKLEPRAVRCIFLGYAIGVKGYRLWCKEKERTPGFFISRDVTFDESAMFGQKVESDVFARKDRGANQMVEFEIETPNMKTTAPVEQPMEEQEDDNRSIAERRPRREIRKTVRYANYVDNCKHYTQKN